MCVGFEALTVAIGHRPGDGLVASEFTADLAPAVAVVVHLPRRVVELLVEFHLLFPCARGRSGHRRADRFVGEHGNAFRVSEGVGAPILGRVPPRTPRETAPSGDPERHARFHRGSRDDGDCRFVRDQTPANCRGGDSKNCRYGEGPVTRLGRVVGRLDYVCREWTPIGGGSEIKSDDWWEQMEPVTMMIATAVAVGASDVAKQIVPDAYAALKALILNRYTAVGAEVAGVESEPDEPLRRQLLAKQLGKTGANKDDELRDAAQELLHQIDQKAPEAAETVGVRLLRIAAGGDIEIADIDVVGGSGVTATDVSAGGSLKITGVKAGVSEPPHPSGARG